MRRTKKALCVVAISVAATVSVAGSHLSATLDPVASLDLDTLYTVRVTPGVTDAAGTPALPFTSTVGGGPGVAVGPGVGVGVGVGTAAPETVTSGLVASTV